MIHHDKCTQCGTTLSSHNVAGQCVSCLFQLALAVSAEDSVSPRAIIAEKPGDRIGPYKIIEILGEGGHGTVYSAEQEYPVRRCVALKVIKLGMDTAQVIARFEAERQALAMMDHPNIAKVLDAGATETGRPFFVMELVRGQRITDYCNNKKLSIKERLDLFAKVCDAVQHAHQKGIIHRDLKPANVLIAESDASAIPKVIDFGIAKAIGGERLTDRTLFTGFDQLIGTPAYMSPEQAGMSGVDIDTRSDIYSLGILLYELLTGKMPFEPKRLFEAGLDEVRRIIREEEPPRPSARISTLNADEKTVVATQHQTEPPRHIQQIRGDLDWIVMKALEKDRERRYQAPTALALDLQRHLNNEPVEARPPSNVYRLRKTIQRNQVAFGAIAAVAASLIAGFAVSTWMFFNEREARQQAALAEQEQTRLREIAEIRAYSSDMNLAAQAAQSGGSLSGVANLLDNWQNHTPDLRGWEWYYLNGFRHHDHRTIKVDTNGLWALSWSPDGERLAVGGDNGIISLWDAKRGHKLSTFNAGATVLCVMWHPVKEQLVSSANNGTVVIWDVSTGTAIRSWQAHTGQVRTVSWSSDGRKLATGGYNEKTIAIWDSETGAEIFRMPGDGFVQTVAWNNDDTILASSGSSTQVTLWDAFTGKQLRVINPGGFAALSWSPDGRFLAMGGYDSRIRIWEGATGKLNAEYFGHGGSIAVLNWSPDGKQIVSTGRDDGAIKVWEPLTGKLLRHFRGHMQGAQSVVWHPDGKKVASASLDGTAKIWETQSGDVSQIQLEHNTPVSSVSWSPDGAQLAVSDKAGQVSIWNGTDKTPAKIFAGRTWSSGVAWHPNGKQIASGGTEGFVEFWDVAPGTNTGSLRAFEPGLRAVAWNPQGTKLAASGSGPLKIWDAAGQNLLVSVDVLYSPCYALDWSPDGTLIAGAAGKTIRIVDVTVGRISQSYTGHRDAARCLAWSPDGKRLFSGGDDIVGLIWDKQSGAILRKLSGHSASIYGVAWSPDGQRIATGSWDCTLKIWNSNTGQELCSIKMQQWPIMALAWHPDGRRIVAGDLGGGLFIHDSSPGF